MPRFCRNCEVLFACNGECPKNRLIESPDGELGLNYLCEGFRVFFTHADPAMKIMADLIQRGRPADEIMKTEMTEKKGDERVSRNPGRNEPCFCGSGLKFKKCHGKRD